MTNTDICNKIQLNIAYGFPMNGANFMIDDIKRRVICESGISGGTLHTEFDLNMVERNYVGVKISFISDAPECWQNEYHTNYLRYITRHPEDRMDFRFGYDVQNRVFSLFKRENINTFFETNGIDKLILRMVKTINNFRFSVADTEYDDFEEDDEINYGDER